MNKRRWCVIIILLSGFFFVSGISTHSRPVSKKGSENSDTGPAISEQKQKQETPAPEKQPSDIRIIKGTVKNGDTVSDILDDYLPMKTIYELCKKSSGVYPLEKLHRGRNYRIKLKNGTLVGFEYEIDRNDKLVLSKDQDTFSITKEPIEYDCNVTVISGTIESNLFSAVKKAGESIEMAIKLSEIFAWDIDFIRDLQPGDHFRVLVKKRNRNGRPAGYEKVMAAFFTNKGTQYKAFLHKDKDGRTGYYDENGNSLQKKFLKAPLSFSRISSGYTNKRLHPIFKTYRPHRGVDYAAPRGTPIKTVGDGTITAAGYNKGMGKYINIRHPNGFETGYNHMSKFAKGMKKNKKVEQGEVIGYVGATGYATGPHLDFRMKKRGNPIDPLKHESPPAKPVNPNEMDSFQAKIDRFSQRILTAQSDSGSGSEDREST
ncbi:MAG: peptidoglycan DD-metalloendopeptidase family protein [Desulfobacteraceae bacterium]